MSHTARISPEDYLDWYEGREELYFCEDCNTHFDRPQNRCQQCHKHFCAECGYSGRIVLCDVCYHEEGTT